MKKKPLGRILRVVMLGSLTFSLALSGCTALGVMDNWFFSSGALRKQAALEKDNTDVVRRTWRFYNQRDYDVLKHTVAQNLAQHDPLIGDGREALIKVFREEFFAHADYHLEIKRMIADDDLVFVHSHMTLKPEDRNDDTARPSYAVASIFRLKDGMIVEHWNVVQAIPEEPSANGNTMFNGGQFQPTSHKVEQKNKEIVIRYMEEFVNQQDLEVLDEIMSADWQAHNPQEANGREALKELARMEWFAQFPEIHAEIKRIGAQGNLVFVQSHYTLKEEDRGNDWAPQSGATVDIFRLQDGLIVEHWDVVRRGLPAQTESGRSLFDGGGLFSPSPPG